MSKLFVIPGHGAGDPGAGGGGLDEADLVRRLATRIKELGGDSVELADFSRNYYADGGLEYESFDADTQIVELHMDSAGAGAFGGHVIVPDAQGYPDAESEALAARISAMFPGRASPIVKRSDLSNPNRAMRRGLRYRLVENGFVSNDVDRSRFISRMDELAQIYLDVFGVNGAKEDCKMVEPCIVHPTGDGWDGATIWVVNPVAEDVHAMAHPDELAACTALGMRTVTMPFAQLAAYVRLIGRGALIEQFVGEVM